MKKQIRFSLVLIMFLAFCGFIVVEAGIVAAHDAPPVGTSVCVDGPFWAVMNGTATTENTGGLKVHVAISATDGVVVQDKVDVKGDGQVITYSVSNISLKSKTVTISATTTWGKNGTDTHSVMIAQPELGCIPPKPDDKVEVVTSDWVLPDFNCPDHAVGTETRTVTTTTTSYTYDEGTNTWMPGVPVVTVQTEQKIVQWVKDGKLVICAQTNPPPTISFHPTPTGSPTDSSNTATPTASEGSSHSSIPRSTPTATVSSSPAATTAIQTVSTDTTLVAAPVSKFQPPLANTGSKTANMIEVGILFLLFGLFCLWISRRGKHSR